MLASVREYRNGIRAFADESHLDVWYDRLNASEIVDHFGGRLGKRGRILFSRPFAKARRKTSLRAVAKLTERVDGEVRFRSVPPLLVPLRELVDPAGQRRDIDYVRGALDAYVRAWTRIAATCSPAIGSWTWPARSSASAASAPVPGCCCSSGVAAAIRSCCR